ncbi:phage tail protein [Rugamonas sp. CCM 8940]|nr:phage tail protein [Rugamonas sp. CCM 8940]
MFAGNYAPAGWMFCDGSILPISENDALFNLIGTTYGGDGQSTFALPDLRGRLPVAAGSGRQLGESLGSEQVTLTTQQIPAHTHALLASGERATPSAGAATGLLANTGGSAVYAHPAAPAPMRSGAISSAGGSQPHDNMAPYLCVSFIISLFGMFPSSS